MKPVALTTRAGMIVFSLFFCMGTYAQQDQAKGPVPFHVFDTDKNGVITKDEFLAIQSQRHSMADGKGMNSPVEFEFFDTDGNGKIIPPELIAGQQILIHRHQKQAMQHSQNADHQPPEFKDLDANGDGAVDLAEFTQFHEQKKHAMPEGKMHGSSPDWAKLFRSIDSDESGSIDDAEFSAHRVSCMDKVQK